MKKITCDENGIPCIIEAQGEDARRICKLLSAAEDANAVSSQVLIRKTYEAEYDLKVLNSENIAIRSFAEGYNACLSNARKMLIMEHGARPLTKVDLLLLEDGECNIQQSI